MDTPNTITPRSSKAHSTTLDKRLTLVDHLEELRRRLGITLVILLVAIGISAVYVERIIEWLKYPIRGTVQSLAFFSPTEPLMAYMKVCLLSGVVIAMPVILWQVWRFISPGLNMRERRYGIIFIWSGTLLFIAGIAFAATILLPVSLRFLLGIGGGSLEPVLSVGKYLDFVTTLSFWCGVVCELPVVLWILGVVGIVTPEWLRQQRPYAILILVILAAVITPTRDPVNLFLLSIPLIVLYEISVLIVRLTCPKARKKPGS